MGRLVTYKKTVGNQRNRWNWRYVSKEGFIDGDRNKERNFLTDFDAEADFYSRFPNGHPTPQEIKESMRLIREKQKQGV